MQHQDVGSSSPSRKPVIRYRSTNQLNLHLQIQQQQHQHAQDCGIEHNSNHSKSYEKTAISSSIGTLVRHRSSDAIRALELNHNNDACFLPKNEMMLIMNNNNSNNNIKENEKSFNNSLSQLLQPVLSATNLNNSNSGITGVTTTMLITSTKSSSFTKHRKYSNIYSLLSTLAILVCFHMRVSYNYYIQRSLIAIQNEYDSVAIRQVKTTIFDNLSPNLYETYDSNNDFVIDIISIGSITKSDFQDAQERTFAKHPNVRKLYRINEHNDTDATCSTSLTTQQVGKITHFCKSSIQQKSLSREAKLIRRLVYYPKNHTGWMCAQKRPIDGLYHVLQQYQQNIVRIPNYLFIIDDDSYMNMIPLIQTLQQNHTIYQDNNNNNSETSAATVPQLITGCRYNYPPKIHFLFPYGGFGTIMSYHVVQHLITPLYCNSSSTTPSATSTTGSFVQAACWRLQQNLMGELPLFTEGMSINELMYVHSKQYPYTKIDTAWAGSVGYCFHSDHALGYFFGYYHISVPDDQFSSFITYKDDGSIVYEYDTLRYQYGYVGLAGEKECKNIRKRCDAHGSRICHYIQPEQMDELYGVYQ